MLWRHSAKLVDDYLQMLRLWTVALGVGLVGCATEEVPKSPFQTRSITPVEQQALQTSLAKALKDPGTAQFKWMPVIVVSDPKMPANQPIGYCGLVNGKNGSGDYVGFQKFYAVLSRDRNNQYVTGAIKYVENPSIVSATSKVDYEAGPVDLQAACKGWGFFDFSEAQ